MTRYDFVLAPLKVEGETMPYDAGSTTEPASDSYDHITLPTGRKFYAHGLTLGLDPDGYVSYGYDGGVEMDDWSVEDREALADLMLARWTEFKNKIRG